MQINQLINNFQVEKPLPLDKSLHFKILTDVFTESRIDSLNEFTLFATHFNAIPNHIQEININCKKASNWLIENFQMEIKNLYYNKRYSKSSKTAEFDDLYFFLYQDLLIYFDSNRRTIRFLFNQTPLTLVEEFVLAFKKFKIRKNRKLPEISLLVNGAMGIETKSLIIQKPKLQIDDNYNDDFKEIHKVIVKRLSKKNDKGLLLLHGKPGTGKTSYIRYLVATLKKDVIFIPPNMATSLTGPSLISVLIDNPNSILVIEDAENIIIDREKDGNSSVSTLLNISDGLLADCLNVQIICSFNTDISKIDAALLRKGRLIAKYEFKELESDKAQRLSDKLGYSTQIDIPMTLTAIYNQHEMDFLVEKKKNPIGFQRN